MFILYSSTPLCKDQSPHSMSTAATVQSQGAPRLPVGAGEAVEATEAVEGVEVRADTQEAGGGRAQRRGHTREHGDSQRRYNAVFWCAKKMKNW